jgi:TRAP-type mannitol/chloroaromatic compound transport system permease large subunit
MQHTNTRHTNPRLVLAGSLLLAMAVAFFFFMLSIASKSNDPAELMRTVGGVSGTVGGLAIAMILIGRIGKKVR